MERGQAEFPATNPRAEPWERSVCSDGAVRRQNSSRLQTSIRAVAREMNHYQHWE
jgi:hypothetical protein